MLLALGPFASPLVAHEDSGFAAEIPIDHRNDLPVVQPGRSVASSVSSRLPSSRSLLVVVLMAGLLVAATPVGRRRPDRVADPASTPLWSHPPHRGPPLLAAG